MQALSTSARYTTTGGFDAIEVSYLTDVISQDNKIEFLLSKVNRSSSYFGWGLGFVRSPLVPVDLNFIVQIKCNGPKFAMPFLCQPMQDDPT